MERFVLVGYCNAVAGQEDEFNEWYWHHHLKDILDLPGVISGRRFVPAGAQLGNVQSPFNYMGLFEVECDDPKALFAELGARASAGHMSQSNSVEPGSSLVLWQLMPDPNQ